MAPELHFCCTSCQILITMQLISTVPHSSLPIYINKSACKVLQKMRTDLLMNKEKRNCFQFILMLGVYRRPSQIFLKCFELENSKAKWAQKNLRLKVLEPLSGLCVTDNRTVCVCARSKDTDCVAEIVKGCFFLSKPSSNSLQIAEMSSEGKKLQFIFPDQFSFLTLQRLWHCFYFMHLTPKEHIILHIFEAEHRESI